MVLTISALSFFACPDETLPFGSVERSTLNCLTISNYKIKLPLRYGFNHSCLRLGFPLVLRNSYL